MRTTRTHYEVLGLSRDATLAQIRRRYKQLVRKYHPDVAADKETAHRLFLQIKEAYEALSDPISRRAYDAALTMERARPSTGAQRSASATGASRPRTGASATISKHIKDARWSFIQRRYKEAAEHCLAALEIDSRNTRAFATLGDIFRAQGKLSAAIKYYSYAVQYDPLDNETRVKLNKLMDRRVARPSRVRAGAGTVRPGEVTSMTINFIWWGIAVFLILLIWVQPGVPIPWLRYYVPQILRWSWNLVGLMAAASAIVGMLLSVNGLVSHPDEELVFESQGSGWAVVPTGLILLIGSGFFFLGAAAFYMVVGLAQGSLSRSVMVVFGAVAGVVLLSSLLYVPAARYEVMLFGGNVSFLSMLIGWYIGSMFKPLGSY